LTSPIHGCFRQLTKFSCPYGAPGLHLSGTGFFEQGTGNGRRNPLLLKILVQAQDPMALCVFTQQGLRCPLV
jgi:hypothetical protein